VLVVQLDELSDCCIANEVPVRERIEEVKSLANIIPLDEDNLPGRVKAQGRATRERLQKLRSSRPTSARGG